MDIKTVEITTLAYGGSGIGRIDGKVVFVPFTAPGDTARVRTTLEKKGFSEAELVELLKPSQLRTSPPCPVFGVCGGCHLQHMDYPAQLEWKQKIFAETLKRIGKIEPAFDPPVGAPKAYGYRSRARFHIEGKRWGFYELKSHRIVDIVHCPIAEAAINDAFARIKGELSGMMLPVYSMELGVSRPDTVAAVFHVFEDKGADWAKALEGTGLKGFEVWLSHDRKGKGKKIFSHGDPALGFSAGGLRFEAGASVFSQVNRDGNESLVKKALEYASIRGTENILDLFAGVGNFTLPLAMRTTGPVNGIEWSGEAVKQADANARANGAANAHFHRGDALNWLLLNRNRLEKERVDMVVLDPPRGGDPELADALKWLRPGRIIYISCSPPTLARDLSALAGSGYRPMRAGLIDMFPQTYHIEAAVSLELA